jgi:hypothetical protein
LGGRPDVIIAIGDIGFSGKPGEYEIATPLFADLLGRRGLNVGACS